MTKLVIDGFIAFGTVAVAVLAIWGDWFRSYLAPLAMTLSEHTLDGDPALFSTGTRAMFYHLKVINQRRWLPAQNCRVMLVGLSRRDPVASFSLYRWPCRGNLYGHQPSLCHPPLPFSENKYLILDTSKSTVTDTSHVSTLPPLISKDSLAHMRRCAISCR
jgi:hypothetical protein